MAHGWVRALNDILRLSVFQRAYVFQTQRQTARAQVISKLYNHPGFKLHQSRKSVMVREEYFQL